MLLTYTSIRLVTVSLILTIYGTGRNTERQQPIRSEVTVNRKGRWALVNNIDLHLYTLGHCFINTDHIWNRKEHRETAANQE